MKSADKEAYLDLLQEVLEAKEAMRKAGIEQASFGEMFKAYSNMKAEQALVIRDALDFSGLTDDAIEDIFFMDGNTSRRRKNINKYIDVLNSIIVQVNKLVPKKKQLCMLSHYEKD